MEVLGYECYANGTVKSKIMRFKEVKRRSRPPEEQFYGCETMRTRASKAPRTERKQEAERRSFRH
ncbi:hypothetical protein [Hydrogenimonas cancrithermarum]|uniref:Uncharacterized protein n=1 Tax=Hydrogenimonas cancrithermarum TaxID=2993563 RepID=A0ABN6WTZ4_9BACT|nr:hypothetical protein [Hydrogenimonas cancrithermarum]BDY11777.1 hypothetical protein HCR_00890 [Hydrogenimonas cancrithermarum]